MLALIALAALAAVAVTVVLRVRARRGLTPEQLAEAQLAELRRALARLDWEVPAATTLLGLERRLGRAAGPASARYAAGLRAHRYDPRAPQAPGSPERRALRRELGSRVGPAPAGCGLSWPSRRAARARHRQSHPARHLDPRYATRTQMRQRANLPSSKVLPLETRHDPRDVS